MRVFHCRQQSDLWYSLRRGRITCSRLGDVLAPPITRKSSRGEAGTEALAREKYRKDLVAERLTLHGVSHYVTRAMEEGVEREPFARMIYEAETQQVVEQVGFVLHPEWDWFGGSADGLCGDDGGVELKCPTEGVHLSYIQNPDLLIEEYKWQSIGNLLCAGREWWDLASFNPYFPDDLKLLRVRMHRSEYLAEIDRIGEEVPKFDAEVEAEIAALGQPPTTWAIPKENSEISTEIPVVSS